MAKCGRPPVLDDVKRREILAILAVGCSRRVAAAYVGCSPTTIQNTAGRDPQFAEALRHAEHQAELSYLRAIQKAARKEQYWRAAAWVLERRNPQDFALRSPDALGPEQVKQLMAECTQIVIEEVPVAEYRKRILKRIGQLLRWALPSQRKPRRRDAQQSTGS